MKKTILYFLILLLAAACHKHVNTTKTEEMPDNQGKFEPITATTIGTNLNMFPKPIDGQRMFAIEVPVTTNDKNYKLEVLVGKTQEVDCNYYFMMGNSEQKSLDGWGYEYTVITSDGGISGTKMGCPDNVKKIDFVHMAPIMFDYNSRFPIVIYVPEFCEVKYRIWSANDQKYDAVTVASETTKKELIRDCPDGKIINAMPTFNVGDSTGGIPSVYYIYKGVRKELYEFDEEWVNKNCKVKTTTAH